MSDLGADIFAAPAPQSTATANFANFAHFNSHAGKCFFPRTLTRDVYKNQETTIVFKTEVLVNVLLRVFGHSYLLRCICNHVTLVLLITKETKCQVSTEMTSFHRRMGKDHQLFF